jgi:hypothetical protein
MAKKTADQLEREMNAKLRKTTPEQQRNIDRRAAEQNRSYGDSNRTKRSNAEIDAKRKSSNAMKPPRAPMMDQPTPKSSAIQRLIKSLKGGKGLGALGLVGVAAEGGKAFTQKKPSKKDPRFQG